MRLIDYDAAIDRYYAEYEEQDICDGAEDRDFLKRCFDDAPTIDSDPVVHGRWIYNEKGNLYRCSVCLGYPSFIPTHCHISKFCPNCGAKMDLPEGGE